jgi:hypothetical protein
MLRDPQSSRPVPLLVLISTRQPLAFISAHSSLLDVVVNGPLEVAVSSGGRPKVCRLNFFDWQCGMTDSEARDYQASAADH